MQTVSLLVITGGYDMIYPIEFHEIPLKSHEIPVVDG